MRKQMKGKKGITLIALVITIIVLLILAGVTIATLTGDNGLIGKAGEAKNAIEIANEKEELEILVTGLYDKRGNLNATKVIDGINKDIKNLNTVTDTDGAFPVNVEYKNGHKYQITKDGNVEREKAIAEYPDAIPGIEAKENSRYISDNKTAIIPDGYTISNKTDEQSIDNGLVITKGGNEWIWIPVSSENLEAMYQEDSTGWIMSGTGEGTEMEAVVTKYKSKGGIISGISRVNPGTTGWREPDTVLGTGTKYDNLQENWIAAGFNSYADMVVKLRNDYKKMIDSVKKYGGFYVGRYELSNAGTQKNQDSLTNINWYKLYKKCSTLGCNSAESRMIWGCQWDQICKYINTYGDKVSLIDSTSYGNYKNSSGDAKVIVEEVNKYGKKQVTGYSDHWKANNIYDLAGNCCEWTQEVSDTNRARRGGDYCDNGPITSRSSYSTTINTQETLSSRPTLYVK